MKKERPKKYTHIVSCMITGNLFQKMEDYIWNSRTTRSDIIRKAIEKYIDIETKAGA